MIVFLSGHFKVARVWNLERVTTKWMPDSLVGAHVVLSSCRLLLFLFCKWREVHLPVKVRSCRLHSGDEGVRSHTNKPGTMSDEHRVPIAIISESAQGEITSKF